MWTLVLRSGAVMSLALAGLQLFDLFFREIRQRCSRRPITPGN